MRKQILITGSAIAAAEEKRAALIEERRKIETSLPTPSIDLSELTKPGEHRSRRAPRGRRGPGNRRRALELLPEIAGRLADAVTLPDPERAFEIEGEIATTEDEIKRLKETLDNLQHEENNHLVESEAYKIKLANCKVELEEISNMTQGSG